MLKIALFGFACKNYEEKKTILLLIINSLKSVIIVMKMILHKRKELHLH